MMIYVTYNGCEDDLGVEKKDSRWVENSIVAKSEIGRRILGKGFV